MAIYVNTNTVSLNTMRKLNISTKSLDRSYVNLSSGLRINSARDDAAGLQISDRMTTQINGLEQGNRNALDGISLLQVAEGSLDEITQNLQRIRTLAIQSANGTNSTAERKALQEEVAQLSAEINRIAEDTSFGGNNILDGEQEFLYTDEFNTGKGFKCLVPISEKHPSDPKISCRDPSHSDKRYSIQVGSNENQIVDFVIGVFVDGIYCHAGCKGLFKTEAYLSCNLNGLYCSSGNPNTKETRVVDRNEPDSAHTTGFCIGDDDLLSLDVSTEKAAQNVIKYLNGYISTIDSMRANFGAVQNRLESAISNQENVIENVSSSRSRIRDTDYAQETSRMTMNSVLQQAASTILVQANMLPQVAKTLLEAA